jgi:hypothetical protein
MPCDRVHPDATAFAGGYERFHVGVREVGIHTAMTRTLARAIPSSSLFD